jgi:hypothetical protein
VASATRLFPALVVGDVHSPVSGKFPVDFKMFIVDKKQNQCAIADAAIVSAGR